MISYSNFFNGKVGTGQCPGEFTALIHCVQMRLWVVLGGCGILNLVLVSVFSCPKTSVSGLVLALKYTKIGKVCAIRILSPGLHINPRILRHHDFLLPSWMAAFHLKRSVLCYFRPLKWQKLHENGSIKVNYDNL